MVDMKHPNDPLYRFSYRLGQVIALAALGVTLFAIGSVFS